MNASRQPLRLNLSIAFWMASTSSGVRCSRERPKSSLVVPTFLPALVGTGAGRAFEAAPMHSSCELLDGRPFFAFTVGKYLIPIDPGPASRLPTTRSVLFSVIGAFLMCYL